MELYGDRPAIHERLLRQRTYPAATILCTIRLLRLCCPGAMEETSTQTAGTQRFRNGPHMRASPLPSSEALLERIGLVLSFLLAISIGLGTSEALASGAETSASKAWPVTDTVRVYETSGKTQSNRPISIARAFRQGE